VNTLKKTYYQMIFAFFIVAAVDAHAATVNYTLDKVILADGQQITGTFDWTYSVDDFEGGSGVFTSLEIPYTIYSFIDGNLNLDIQSDSIEISGNGNYHDVGLDITLKLSQSFTPTQSASMDLGLSFFECCGNGFKDQPFQSGSIVPTTVLAGDFDTDGDVDGSDFLKWQRGDVSSPPSTSDLAAWEVNYGTVAPLSAASASVPEPSAVLLGVMASLLGISCRRRA
jgi:hypothetical protein